MAERKIYLKFKIDNAGHGMMSAFLVSEDLDNIKAWDGGKGESQKSADRTNHKPSGTFKKVSEDFIRAIRVYQNSVPFIMSTVPVLGQMVDDRRIRGFAKKNGNCVESGEFEVYELSIDHVIQLTRIMDQAISVKAGIEAMPRLFFLGLVSAYDAFLSDLIRAILVVRPEMLSSSEKNISFKDLMAMGSVEAARDFLIEKEIESVIRTSHSDQIKWLENKLSITLTKDLSIYPEFIELCERRNLFTHTNGIVSSQYCKVCADNKFKHSVNVGDSLTIDAKYFKKSISIIFEIGVKLTQVIWRKLLPDEIDIAAMDLNHIAYESISKRGYKSADMLLSFGLDVMKKHGNDATKKMMIINRANALKLGGEKDKALSVIDNEDWSASTDNYKICVAAIRDDIPAVIDLMHKVVVSGLLSTVEMREWPVFEKARADERFVEAFETIFGEKLLSDKETTARPAVVKANADDGDAEALGSSSVVDSESKRLH